MKQSLALIIFLGSFFLPQVLRSQEKSRIGVTLFTELYPNPGLKPAGGLVYQYHFSKKQALQTALLYRTSAINGMFITNTGEPYIFTVSMRYLGTYFLYRRVVKKFNLSAGPGFEYFISWRQKPDGNAVKIDRVTESPRLALGLLAIVSREIPINNKFILEPQLRFGNIRNISSPGDAVISLGIIGWINVL